MPTARRRGSHGREGRPPAPARAAGARPDAGSAAQGSTRARGRAAEEEAVRWLEVAGYRVLERNVVHGGSEIDIVARDAGGVLCFIEVKARATATYGPAIAAITAAKRRRICRAASLHLAVRGLHLTPCRFDVLGLDRTPEGWRFTLVRDAFPFAL